MTGSGDRQHRSARRYPAELAQQVQLRASAELALRGGRFSRTLITVLDGVEGPRTLGWAGSGAAVLSRDESDLAAEVVRTGQPACVGDNALIGVPLTGRESLVIGALCALDPQPSSDASVQVARLVQVAGIVEDQLDLLRRLDPAGVRSDITSADLLAAIEAGEIVPWYQPVVELGTGRTIGYEALARWECPGGAVVGPDQFIHVAEDSDLIVDLDLRVMRHALADLHRWQVSRPDLRMSVNLSGRHVDFPTSVDELCSIAEQSGVPPTSIDLELTETARLRAGQAVGAVTQRLREIGFRIWLDDFGTGWSSLEHLLQVAVDGLKIDRAFAAALDHQIGTTLTRAIITVAMELGLQITIEGIETTDQALRAAELGCDFAQGFLWSGAVPGSVIDLE